MLLLLGLCGVVANRGWFAELEVLAGAHLVVQWLWLSATGVAVARLADTGAPARG